MSVLLENTIKRIYPTAKKITLGIDVITIYLENDKKVITYDDFYQIRINHIILLNGVYGNNTKLNIK